MVKCKKIEKEFTEFLRQTKSYPGQTYGFFDSRCEKDIYFLATLHSAAT